MLRIWFGDIPNAIYNTSVFFKNRYKDKWITDSFAREIIKDIDKSEVVSGEAIKTKSTFRRCQSFVVNEIQRKLR